MTLKFQKRLFLIAAAGVLACGRDSSSTSNTGEALSVVLDTTAGVASATVAVTGFSTTQLRAMRNAQLSADAWGKALRLSLPGNDSVAVVGRHWVSDSAIHFRPMFPLDAGREYSVRFDPATIPSVAGLAPVTAPISLPAANSTPSTRVVGVFPSSGNVPENLLRLYIEFSAPMSRSSGLDFVKLLDSAGKEVPEAFLPLEADFWNDDATRYTLFLDPGRVKRGILSNEQLGRALEQGKRYSVRVDSGWRDARGQPLVASHRYEMRAGAADDQKISLAAWKVLPPRARTRDTLAVSFPRPLDAGLLRRALGVLDAAGRQVIGDVELSRGETGWHFAPRDAWRAGDYQLLVLSILEDVAGNRIDRPFEVDMFERSDRDTAPEKHFIPFVVR